MERRTGRQKEPCWKGGKEGKRSPVGKEDRKEKEPIKSERRTGRQLENEKHRDGGKDEMNEVELINLKINKKRKR